MDLTELGQEYLAQEKAIKSRIYQLRRQLLDASEETRSLLTRRINLLYITCRSLHKTGEYLTTYYQKSPAKRADRHIKEEQAQCKKSR